MSDVLIKSLVDLSQQLCHGERYGCSAYPILVDVFGFHGFQLEPLNDLIALNILE